MKRTVDIVALDGDAVMVLNYRKRPVDWEQGTVGEVKTRWTRGGEHTTYSVVLDRRSDAGNPIWLYVSGDDIEGVR